MGSDLFKMKDSTAIDAAHYPLLSRLLATDAGPRLREELHRLTQARRKQPRRETRVVARLQRGTRAASVVLQNISDGGFLTSLPRATALALGEAVDLTLVLRTDHGVLELPVALVRVAAVEGEDMQVAFRFLEIKPHQVLQLHLISSLLLGDLMWLHPPSVAGHA